MGTSTTTKTQSTLSNTNFEANNNEDQRLLALLAQGDQKAVDVLFNKYYDYLCNVSYRIVRDSNHAEDIVQDLFMWMWKNREVVNITLSLRVYLKRAAVNRSLNHLRGKRVSYENETFAEHLEDGNVTAQVQMEQSEFTTQLMNCIEELPPQCRKVFKMSRFEDMTYQEIANQLELSVKTVGNHIAKALKTLRVTVEPQVQLYY